MAQFGSSATGTKKAMLQEFGPIDSSYGKAVLVATPVGKDSMEIHFIHRITEYPAGPGVPATVAGQVLGLMGDIDSDSKLASWVRLPDALFERVTSKGPPSGRDGQ